MTQQEDALLIVLNVVGIVVLVLTFYILLTFEDCWSLDLSFESEDPRVEWCYYYDGNGDVTLSSTATHESQSVRLGKPVRPTSWITMTSKVYTEMVIPDDQDRPVLSFWYRMCANDILDMSDFRAYLITSTVDILGTGPITAELIKRDGYRYCEATPTRPLACYDLKWRTASYDLTDLKGQTVTLVFEANNLYTNSLGIWTYVDHVQVVDAGPLPTAGPLPAAELHYIYLPMTMRDYSACDGSDDESICDCP